MDLRKCDLNNVIWTRRSSSGGSDADVSIRKCKSGGLNFTFRNSVLPNITETEYIQIGILDGALLFRTSSRSEGYKVTLKKTTGNYHVCIRNEALDEWAQEFNGEGDYTARMFRKYIYIDPDTTKRDKGGSEND